jgi:hypothetical protein
MFSRLFLDCQLSLMIFENRIQGEALKSGPKGREEIAMSVRAWAQNALSIKGGPKGRHSHQPCRTFGARRSWFDFLAHALTDVATTWRAFGAHGLAIQIENVWGHP